MQARRRTQFSEIDDQSAVFGDGDKFARRDLAAGRMRPAAECLNADDNFAAFVDHRLIDELQSVFLDRLAQVRFEQLAARKIRIHRGVIDARAIAAFVLGAIERHVGIAHDVGRGRRTCCRLLRCRSRRR